MDSVIVAQIGEPALAALADAVRAAQRDDPFARVVVVADHLDVAAALRHHLGAQGTINVTAQKGERLAAELARPMMRPVGADGDPQLRKLTPLVESQAVQQVVDGWLESASLELSAAGRRRLYSEIGRAFRDWEQRHSKDGEPTVGQDVASPLNLPSLHDDYRQLLDERGYYTRYELPLLAARALREHWSEGTEPAVIHYLPKHPGIGELELMETLLARGKCAVIIGLTGDDEADGPARELYARLAGPDIQCDGIMPLRQAVDGEAMSVVVAPDPTEEARAVVRRIAAMADDLPFHRVAVVHRQEAPYASLLRQELDFAGIPYSGVPRRTLADTGQGRFLLGSLRLVEAMGRAGGSEPVIDRELFVELIMSCRVRFPRNADDGRRRSVQDVPATHWVNLTRAARADGTLREWTDRLRVHAEVEDRRYRERSPDESTPAGSGQPQRRDIDELVGFLGAFGPRLELLSGAGGASWQSAKSMLKGLLADFHGRDEGDDDHDRIEEMLDGLDALTTWDAEYSVEALRDAVNEGLQGQVSQRGKPVGAGVYIGPVQGIVGTRHDVVFAVGMVEGQFPPGYRARMVDEWLDDGTAARMQGSLERYEFLGAVAAADRVMLSYPLTAGNRRGAYPSRWLMETANLLHEGAGTASGRLTSETLTAGAEAKPWLHVIESRQTGLRQLADSTDDAATGISTSPADALDYNLMHLLHERKADLASHPALHGDARAVKALDARAARWGYTLTSWDGNVGAESARVAGIGDANHHTSPSALETWATCPYRYFLSRALRVNAPPDAGDDGEISALDRGSLVHRILEEFVKSGPQSAERLIALADAQFALAEQSGITGYPLLWRLEKEKIREGLEQFAEKESDWLGGAPVESIAEMTFDDVTVNLEGIGEVRFRGKIDRVDVLGDEVRVRDFKTGNPRNYFVGSRGGQPQYNIANGRALQLPVYAAAAKARFPAATISASYCFPLDEQRIFDPAPYTDSNGSEGFEGALTKIIRTARAGVFPATPEGGEYGNCGYCDFNRLCPSRRRQMWERKGKSDPAVRLYNELGGRAAIGSDEPDN